MNGPVVFVDTETTSLELPGLPVRYRDYSCRIWEAAYLAPSPGGGVTARSWFIRRADLDLEGADPKSLEIGRFHERHPEGDRFVPGPDEAVPPVFPEEYVLRELAAATEGRARIHGSHPAFDMFRLEFRMRLHGIRPGWHHHPFDVPNMAASWLSVKQLPLPAGRKSDDLSRAVGVAPENYDRHAALGDCWWMYDVWLAVGSPGVSSS